MLVRLSFVMGGGLIYNPYWGIAQRKSPAVLQLINIQLHPPLYEVERGNEGVCSSLEE